MSLDDTILNSFLNGDDDDESIALQKAKSSTNESQKLSSYGDGSIERLIDNNIKILRDKFPMGGVKSSRFITTDVLMKAPKGYFSQYDEIVQKGVNNVQAQLAEQKKAELIADTAGDPTNEEKLDIAYRTVHSIAASFLDKHPHRGRDKAVILTIICSEIIGFGPLDPLWRDPRISEILCNGPKDIQIEINGQIYKVPSCEFRDQEHLMNLLKRLFEAVGKTLSRVTPLLNGRLHDKSRIYATHTAVSPDGPNFSIRRHQKDYITPEDYLKWGAASEEMLTEIGNLIYRGASWLALGGAGSGKALTLDTKIPTPYGITTMGEITPGDKVFDHYGKVATVLEKYMQPERQVYEIIFDNGEKSYCDAEHNWFVSTFKSRKSSLYKIREKEKIKLERKIRYSNSQIIKLKEKLSVTTKDEYITLVNFKEETGITVPNIVKKKTLEDTYKRNSLYPKYSLLENLISYGEEHTRDKKYKMAPLYNIMTTQEMLDSNNIIMKDGRCNFRVPTLQSVVHYNYNEEEKTGLEPEELLIHPYLFGLWLGYGNFYSDKITATEEDALEYNKIFEKLKIQERLSSTSNKLSWSIKGFNFQGRLNELGLMEKIIGGNKFIPKEYLYSSEKSRRFLIAGLLDSEGSATKRGAWEFYNNNLDLLDNYYKISSSLGYCPKKYSYNGEIDQGKLSGIIKITTNDSLALLPRKIEKHIKHIRKNDLSKNRERGIISINPVQGRIEKMACITVSSKDSTYLIGDSFTTTHNTTLLNAMSGFIAPTARIVTIEDNLEMKLHPKKYLAAPLETLPPKSEDPDSRGITMRDLVKASLRLRPDGIIIGEVRDESAYDLCQALNTGHWGASTIHANSERDGIYRLVSLVSQGGLMAGDAALPLIAASFDFMIQLKRFPEDGSRRIISISEVSPYPITDENGTLTLPVNKIWNFVHDGMKDKKITGHWEKVGEISQTRKENLLMDTVKPLTWSQLAALSRI